jgi:lysophospholipase L1-like esterase
MLRRLFAPVVALVVAGSVALSSACDKNPGGPSVTPTSEVVALGDSLTYGSGTTGGNDYVSVLSRRVGVTIFNAGVPGSTTGAALSRLDTSVLARDPRIVIVLLGGNDLLDGVPVQTRIDNITTIVQRIRGTGAAVILVGVGSPPIDPFNGALPALASSTGSTYVPDILDGVFGVPSLMADAVHPNNAGHAIIADRLEPSLRAALATSPQGRF